MAINGSSQSAMTETPIYHPQSSSVPSAASTGWKNSVGACTSSGQGAPEAPSPSKASGSLWATHKACTSGNSSQHNRPDSQTMIHTPDTIPSAPPVADETVEDNPIQYPSIDLVTWLDACFVLPLQDQSGCKVVCRLTANARTQ